MPWNSEVETHRGSLVRPDVSPYFEVNGEVRLGGGECHLGICSMTRKRHQRSVRMDGEYVKTLMKSARNP